MSTSKSTSEPIRHPESPDGVTLSASHADEADVWLTGLLTRQRRRLILPAIQLAGVAAVAGVSVVLAYVMALGWPATLSPRPSGWLALAPGILRTAVAPEFRPYLAVLAVSPLVCVTVFQWMGLFKTHYGDIVPFGRIPAIVKGTVIAAGGVALLGLVYSGTGIGTNFPLLFFVYHGLLLLFGVTLFHAGLLIGVLVLHSLNMGLPKVAIIGGGPAAERLVQTYLAPSSVYHLAGQILVSSDETGIADTVKLGTVDQLAEAINEHDIDEIVVAMDHNELAAQARLDLALTCWRMGVDIKLVAPFYPYFHTATQPQQLGGVPLLLVEKAGLYARWPQMLKRAMDIVIAATVLVLSSPILIAGMVAVKLDSPGPIFFVQKRVGLNGRVFRMLKLRSMRQDADPKVHQAYLQALIKNKEAHEVTEDGKKVYKMTKDPRITRVGQFIRKTSIDELPQLINVLRGEMSLVGPRPSIPYEVAEYEQWHLRRLNIRPGITGLWQVSGRSHLSYEEMIRLDIRYVDEWSLWLDFKILLKTIPVVLRIEQSY